MTITDLLNVSRLNRSSLRVLAAALFVCVTTATVNAQVVYDDAVNGFASNDGAAPTLVDFNVGSNFVNGTVSAGAGVSNTRNFYTFQIDPGQELDAIVLDSLIVDADDPGFFALVAGATSATPGSGFANLGGQLYDPTDVGSDLLANINTGGNSDGTGFTTIGPGDYTFVIQQTGNEISNYSLDFQVSTAVPEPTSAVVLAGVGVVGLLRRRRR